jgi:hypothetical protein
MIFLFGIHISGYEPFTVHESTFLSRTVHNMQSVQPGYVLHHIQAEVLLAHYFLRQGRFLEAMHRINAAISLSIASGLHKRDSLTAASTSSSPVEMGERIDAFWTILGLHKVWGVTLQFPSMITHILEEEMDLPWPLNGNTYTAVCRCALVS